MALSTIANGASSGAAKAAVNAAIAQINANQLATPLVVYVKNLTILTAATPADLGTITVPTSWLTRYAITGGAIVAETAAGTLAGAALQLRSASAGGGTLLGTVSACPTASSNHVAVAGSSNGVGSVATIYVHQTTNSANAGTISVYLILNPAL